MRCIPFCGLMAAAVLACNRPAEPLPPVSTRPEIRGADLSFLPEVRASGLVFYHADNQPEDMLKSMQKAGVNVVRLRLWKDPESPTSSFETVKQLAAEVKNSGMDVLLTVHYADTWADPNHQSTPRQWENADPMVLKDSIYNYTKKIIAEINPTYIQIGNEINNGFVWPQGHIYHLAQMKIFLTAAIAAVRSSNPETKIILHYAGYEGANAFFQQLSDIDYDIIGISYYPIWHGKDLAALQHSLQTIAQNADKQIFIAETSYPFSLGWNDWTNNVVGDSSQLLAAYPPNPAGQQAYLSALRQMVFALPDSLGLGFCYWGGEWVSYRGPQAQDGSSWENQALWDFEGKLLPASTEFEAK